MESNSSSFVLYLDHPLLFTDQTVQFTHYVIFAKINGIFIKEPVVYNVIKYALQNKHPQCRSAFTYSENELPSRMNFGKRMYGVPFITE